MILSSLKELFQFRSTLNCAVVATNGCFDIIHAGHIEYLQAARAMGDRLIIGLNSDKSVTALKGAGRPINNQSNRAMVLSSLRFVDDVFIFDGLRCDDFLEAVRPNVYVKGGDYTLETLDRLERSAVGNARIVFVPTVQGHSTTMVLGKITTS